jgi:hypothetical protein
MQDLYGDTNLLNLILDMDQYAFVTLAGEGNPLNTPYPASANDYAGLSKGLTGADGATLFNYYAYLTNPSGEINPEPTFAADWTRNIDWDGINTTGFNFEAVDLSNSNITGSQLSNSGRYYLSNVNASSLNMAGFNPSGKSIQSSSFNNTSNVNVSDIIKADDFSYTSFSGATKPDGAQVTAADFEAALKSLYPPNGGTKMSQLGTVSF